MSIWSGLRCVGIVLGSVLLAGLPSSAQANSITYTYTGNVPTFSFGQTPSGLGPVTGTFTIPVPLGPNLALQPLNVNTFLSSTFTDGLHSFDGKTSGLFEVGTDGSGNINAWNIQIYTDCLPVDGASCAHVFLTIENSFLGHADGVYGLDASFQTLWVSGASPVGVWSSAAAAVPEPTTLFLCLAGLLAGTKSIGRRVLS